jgi:hypothetical protein
METPDIQVFNEMLNKAISIWSTYDDTYGYASEKINYIKSLTNVQDNAMVFYRMFDHFNQSKFLENISSATFTYIQNNQ